MAKGGGGGAVLREERHIDNECMRSHQKGEFRPAIRGGGGVLSVSGPIRKVGGGWGEGVLSASGPIRKVGGGGGLLAVR